VYIRVGRYVPRKLSTGECGQDTGAHAADWLPIRCQVGLGLFCGGRIRLGAGEQPPEISEEEQDEQDQYKQGKNKLLHVASQLPNEQNMR
jgi:hypothetical protein